MTTTNCFLVPKVHLLLIARLRLRSAVLLLTMLCSLTVGAQKSAIQRGDPIIASSTNSPATEGVANAIDGTTAKYLNFDSGRDGRQIVSPTNGFSPSGFVVSPSAGLTLVTGMTIQSANDAPERDPDVVLLEGSNDASVTSFNAGNWQAITTISNMARGFTARLQTLTFSFENSMSYMRYRWTVLRARTTPNGCCMQVAEVTLHGTATVVPATEPPVLYRAVGGPSLNQVTVVFSEAVGAAAANLANFSIPGLTISTATLASGGTNIVLSTSAQTANTVYNVTVKDVKDVNQGSVMSPNPTTVHFTSLLLSQGALQKYWTNITPNNIAVLTNDARFPNIPSFTTLEPNFEYPANGLNEAGTNYGNQLISYLSPATTGDFVFFLCSDDPSVLYLSTDENPANKHLIARETAWSNARQWTASGGSSDLSAKRSDKFAFSEWPTPNTIHLTAGKLYYMEALHTEGGGGDNVGVAWIRAGAAAPTDGSPPIPRANLFAYLNPEVTATIAITQPGDRIFASSTNSLLSEGVANAIDNNQATKYVVQPTNGYPPSAFVVSPSIGRSLVTGISIQSADDPPDRDPDAILLEGSNDSTITNFADGTWEAITTISNVASGFTARFQTQTFHFDNSKPYLHYRWTALRVRTSPDGCCMQVAEVTLRGAAVVEPLREPPVITQQPRSFMVLCCIPLTNDIPEAEFSVTATGAPPLSYQWRFNGKDISGATNASYPIFNARTNDAGIYDVVVFNSSGSVPSAPAVLTVVSDFVTQPGDRIIASSTNSPLTEGAANAIDNNQATKYLNFDSGRDGRQIVSPTNGFSPSGFAVSPSIGRSLVTGLSIQSADDAPERDPDVILLEGSNDSTMTSFASGTWEAITTVSNVAAGFTARFQTQTFRFDNVKPYQHYRWTVLRVRTTPNGCCMQVAEVILLGVAAVVPLEPPVITQQPRSIIVETNSAPEFSVMATGAPPLSYQWRFNGKNIPGETNASYTIFNAQSNNAGTYDVVVSNRSGTAISELAILDFSLPPVISQQPRSIIVETNSSPEFSVTATGAPPLSYQWRFNGKNIPGATNANYTIFNAQANNAGIYDVVVFNSSGLVPSAPAVLTVVSKFVTQPGDRIFASSTNSPPSEGVANAIDNNQTTKYLNFDSGRDGRQIVSPTNGFSPSGFAVSPSIGRSLVTGISLQSANDAPERDPDVILLEGSNDSTMTSFASGTWEAITTISNIADGFTARFQTQAFRFDNVKPYLHYRWTVLRTGTTPNGCCMQVAEVTLLGTTVVAPPPGAPVITRQPQSQTVVIGNPVTFSVTATGTPPLSYQWRFNGVAIPTATGSTLTVNMIQLADDGSAFSVVVTNAAGSAESAVAILTVVQDTTRPRLVSATGDASFTRVTIRFDEPVDPASATESLNYSIGGGLAITGVVMGADGRSAIISTSRQAQDTIYTLTARGVRDRATTPNAIADNSTAQFHSFVFSPGFVLFEAYSTGAGSAVSNLTNHPLFPKSPHHPSFLPSFDTRTIYPDDDHDDYGARITGLFVPKASGNYIFYLKSDAASELWFNPAGADAGGAILIQAETACCGQFLEHASPLQALKAGQHYFIMALYKAGIGTDYCQVAVKLDTDPTSLDALQPIGGGSLGLFADPACAQIVVTQQPTNTTAAVGCIAACFTVAATGTTCAGTNAPVAYQWQRNGAAGFADIPGSNGAAFCASVTLADNGAQFRVIVSIPGATVASQSATVTVVPDKTPPALVSATANCASNKIALTFSECLNASTIADRVNYQISGGVKIQSAVLTADGRTVLLIIDALTSGVSYTLTASNVQDMSGNAIASGSTITFTCGTAPTITQQPLNLLVVAGEDALFNMTISGTPPFTNTLVKTNLPASSRAGSTTGRLVLPAAMLSDAGSYQVKASNAFGMTISQAAVLTVEPRTNFLALLDSTGALKIIGTAGDEDIEVRRAATDPARLEVDDLRTPGRDFSFPVAGITAIIVDLWKGQDRIVFMTDAALVGLPDPVVVRANTDVFWNNGVKSSPWWEMTCPADITVPCSGPTGTVLSLAAPSATYHNWTGSHSADAVYFSRNLMNPFPVGTTPVCWTAYWQSLSFEKHYYSCCFNVTVTAGQPPTCTATPGPSYSANFSSGWPVGMQHYGNAIVQSGALKLTRNINSQYGVAVLPQFNGNNSLIHAFRTTFKLYIGGGTTADGFSFNLANDIPSAIPGGTGEEGIGTGLTVSFDTFDNDGGANSDNLGVFIKSGGTLIAGTVFQPSQGPAVTIPGWYDVEITMDTCGYVKVFYNGQQRAAAQVPYVPGFSARFALAARTGGLNDNHWVDDLVITTEFGGPDITVNALANQCSRVVTYSVPAFTASCGSPTIVCVPPSGTSFPVGITRVCCTATDSSGNIGRCGFNVIVKDITPPVINCSQISGLSSVNCVGFLPDYRGYVTAWTTDNCPLPSPLFVMQSPTPGTAVTPGPTTVTLTVCDASGNCTSCTTIFSLTVPLKPIPGVFSTGVDDGSVLLVAANSAILPVGTPAPNYSGDGFTPLVIKTPPSGWPPNTPDCGWIGPTPNGMGVPPGVYSYRLSFYLACATDVHILGTWMTSAAATMWLNGVPTPFQTTAPNLASMFSLNSGFVVGPNTVEFRVPTVQSVNALRVCVNQAVYQCCECGPEPPSGLVFWLPLDEPNTTGVAHNVAGGNNGIYQGSPTVNPSYGYVDRSLCFDGVNQYVRVPYYSAIDFGTGNFSIDAWVKRDTGDTGIRQIVDHRSDPGTGLRGYALYLNNGVLTFEMRDAAGGLVIQAGQTVPSDGNWHFVAVAVKRNSNQSGPLGTLFMDNLSGINFNPTAASGSLANGSSLTIGAKNYSSIGAQEAFKGCIDEVEIFNRQLGSVDFGKVRQGKCKQGCTLPLVGFCPGDQTVTVTATLCNKSANPETYTYGVAGLLPGYPLSTWLSFGGVPATTATVPPWTCTTITFTVPRPPGLVWPKYGFIKLIVQANYSGELIVRKAKVYDKTWWNCLFRIEESKQKMMLTEADGGAGGRFTFGPISLTNPFDTNVVLNYRTRVEGPDMEDDTSVIMLNGLPPGTSITNSLALASGESSIIEISGQFLENDPNQTYFISVEGRVDDTEEWAALGVLTLSEIFQARMAIIYLPVDGVLQPAVSWSGFGTLESAPALEGPWTDVPDAKNPRLIQPGRVQTEFYRLRQ